MSETKFSVELDEAELTVRLIERGCGLRRPPGMAPREALADMEANADKDSVQFFHNLARVALEFFGESVGNLKRVS